MYRGKGNSNGRPHFSCGTNNAVYVAMDKIIKKCDTFTTSKESPGPPITQHPRPATRRQTTKGVMARVLEFLQLGGDETLTTDPVPPPPPADPVPPPPTDPHRQFTIGSMVCVDVQKGEPLYGVLQWVGTVPDFTGTIAGVELVSDNEKLCVLFNII